MLHYSAFCQSIRTHKSCQLTDVQPNPHRRPALFPLQYSPNQFEHPHHPKPERKAPLRVHRLLFMYIINLSPRAMELLKPSLSLSRIRKIDCTSAVLPVHFRAFSGCSIYNIHTRTRIKHTSVSRAPRHVFSSARWDKAWTEREVDDGEKSHFRFAFSRRGKSRARRWW